MKQIIAFANNGGKVLGVCNGFQVLCEAGLLPGALLRNDKQKFICKNLYLKPEGYFKDLVLSDVESLQKSYKIPIAHGEGRYFAEDNILDELEANGQVIFRYSDENGNVVPEANPNGSLRNIAGICNATRNVFGMMPHPERACSAVLGNIDGQKILQVLLMAKQPA